MHSRVVLGKPNNCPLFAFFPEKVNCGLVGPDKLSVAQDANYANIHVIWINHDQKQRH